MTSYELIRADFPWLPPLLAGVLGLIVGSFLNVCIYRIPAGKSVVFPGSHCACGRPIAWHDNVPVLGWLWLRGRARCCGRPIPVRYPAVELLTGLLFAACWMTLPPARALVLLPFIASLIAATFIDLDHMIIPDRFSIGGTVAGVACALAFPALHEAGPWGDAGAHVRSAFEAICGVLVGSGVLLWIGLVAEKLLRREAMGFGDVKLMGSIGAFLGWKGALVSIFGGATLGCLALLGVALWKAFQPAPPSEPDEAEKMEAAHAGTLLPEDRPALFGRETPFGPMLAAGALFHLLLAQEATDPYLNVLLELATGW